MKVTQLHKVLGSSSRILSILFIALMRIYITICLYAYLLWLDYTPFKNRNQILLNLISSMPDKMDPQQHVEILKKYVLNKKMDGWIFE